MRLYSLTRAVLYFAITIAMSNCSFKNKETVTEPSISLSSTDSTTTTTTTVTTTSSTTTTATVPVVISGPLPAQNAMSLSVTLPTTTFSNPYYVGNSATPTIRVSGVNSGNRVRLYAWPIAGPYTCVTNSGEGVANSTSVDITISPALSSGDYAIVPIADDGAGNDTACPSVASYPAIPIVLYRYAAPIIPAVSTVTSSNTDGTYYGALAGPIDITLHFSADVTVTGAPRILLNTTPARYATYVSGSTTQDLVFRYTIVSGDVSADLDYVDANSLGLNSGTIKSTADSSIDATLTLPAPNSTHSLGDQYNFVIQANVGAYIISCTPTGGALGSATYYHIGDNFDIDVTFSENVTVTGTPQLTINLDGSTAVTANYLSGSGSTTLKFRYVISSGNFSDNLSVGASISLNGGTIKRTSDNVNSMLSIMGSNFSNAYVTSLSTGNRKLTANTKRTMGVDDQGALKAWGYVPVYSVSGFGSVTYPSALSPINYDSSGDLYVQVEESKYTYNFGCGLTLMGKVKCWGHDYYTGYGSVHYTPYYHRPGLMTSLSGRYTQITVGTEHACALSADGKPYCWGNIFSGEAGGGVMAALQASAILADSSSDTYTQLSAGYYHTCGITTTNKIKCWGWNANYQTVPGDNSTTAFSTPQYVDSGTNYQFVLASQAASKAVFAITSSGTLKTWSGVNANITTVDPGVNYSKVSSNGNTHCGITTAGVVRCWGANLSGELARPTGTDNDMQTPANISDSATTYRDVSVGTNHVCGITQANVAKCWGGNLYGQLGTGSTTDGKTMTVMKYPYTFVEFHKIYPSYLPTNSDPTLAKDSLGNWYTWGYYPYAQPLTLPGGIKDVASRIWINLAGELYFMGNAVDASTATHLDVGISYTKVRSSTPFGSGNAQQNFCALTSTNKLKCWEYSTGSPTLVDGDDYLDFTVTGQNFCAINSSGVLKCWGSNNAGQLGNGDNTSTPVAAPTVIDSGVTYKSISMSEFGQTCGVTTAGELKCWGYPYYGGVGNGTWNYNNVYSPLSVDPGETYNIVKTIGSSTCALTTANKLKCWGGSLSNGDHNSVPRTPTTYDSSTDYSVIIEASSYYDNSSICAITTGGVTKCMNYSDPNNAIYNYHNADLGYFFDLPTAVSGF